MAKDELGKRYFSYSNSGKIEQVLNRENGTFHFSIKDILVHIKEEYHTFQSYKLNDFKIIFYAYDPRINRDVYIIVAHHSNYKNQFIRYFIEN